MSPDGAPGLSGAGSSAGASSGSSSASTGGSSGSVLTSPVNQPGLLLLIGPWTGAGAGVRGAFPLNHPPLLCAGSGAGSSTGSGVLNHPGRLDAVLVVSVVT